MEVCEPLRACRSRKVRLDGLSATGWCAGLNRTYHGVREHILFTPQGRIARLVQVAGNRHDVNGLYALLGKAFSGTLLGDNAYRPRPDMRDRLAAQGVHVLFEGKEADRPGPPPITRAWLHGLRGRVERRVGLFDRQFGAGITLNRRAAHYVARRWAKALAHNASRHMNVLLRLPEESTLHFRLAA